MSTDKNTQAFPAGNPTHGGNKGIELRDYFAAKAMQGILVNSGRNRFDPDDHETIVNFAYRLADAMLKAREAV